jgi:hypothetical protein
MKFDKDHRENERMNKMIKTESDFHDTKNNYTRYSKGLSEIVVN